MSKWRRWSTRAWLGARPAAPGALTAALLVGVGGLFLLFVVPQPTYQNLPPLFSRGAAATAPAPAAGATRSNASAPTQGPRLIPVQVRGMERDAALQPNSDARVIWLMRQRIGANILAASGYLETAELVVDSSGPPPPQMHHVLRPHPEALSCAASLRFGAGQRPETEGGPALDELEQAALFALAIVAVEKFHRTSLHRRVEWYYASLFAAVFRRMPDLSFGAAQIRLSTLRRTAAQAGGTTGPFSLLSRPEPELLTLLRNECSALHLVTLLMARALATTEEPNCPDDWDEARCPTREALAAAVYAGQRRRTHAIIDYGPIVATMVEMMRN